MNPTTKIFLTGHRGMVGSALHRALLARGCENLVLRTRQELDLCNESAVDAIIASERPKVVIVGAARVGGIYANNTYPAEFIHENLTTAHNLVHSSWKHGVKRLLFLGSSCIYPRDAEQPLTEASLLTGPLEPTNEPYAIAKIAGLKLCQYYRKQYGVLYHSAMPTNLYGPGDNYHPENSHVLPALLRRFHEATEAGAPSVTLWGTGSPLREFLHVDDLAAGCLHLLELEDPPDWVNIGYGSDVSIKELAEVIREVTGFPGALEWDSSKPDGTPRKLMSSDIIRQSGWKPKIALREGIDSTYTNFKEALADGSLRG
ncbi:MAG: GDP-L-fucose synthase [Verrucomicrobiota bacterium]